MREHGSLWFVTRRAFKNTSNRHDYLSSTLGQIAGYFATLVSQHKGMIHSGVPLRDPLPKTSWWVLLVSVSKIRLYDRLGESKVKGEGMAVTYMSYCLFNLYVGSIRTRETAKLQTAAFSILAWLWWEENADLWEDRKWDKLLNVNITVYFKKVEYLILQIIIKRIFYSSVSSSYSSVRIILSQVCQAAVSG